ncbi:hypothetical protein IscW_ISCW019661 [Ixodes scapularis]|uniref:Endonuclease/exonuclease/phosphatase domain-containing protein n=1 Tax=Ixodes scapularis TaxID=6945 RepID=B7PWM6_IXOSC|nr:hypothetical protein IscW_ISCW019661 [Ixodes scapularis]|eukprot:XP_002410076.1 hypothetical protein IscW_ISCW019661 [Ixodes scapularis]
MDSRRDVRGPGYGRTTWNASELIRLMQKFDLVDCWTLLHGTTFEHTWQQGDSSRRFNRCYTSEFLSPSVTACCAMNLPPSIAHISDHHPVLVELRFSSVASSQRAWRLDNRLLRDKKQAATAQEKPCAGLSTEWHRTRRPFTGFKRANGWRAWRRVLPGVGATPSSSETPHCEFGSCDGAAQGPS